MSGSPYKLSGAVRTAAFLLAAIWLFWKFRIVESARLSIVTMRSIDLYAEHYPRAVFASESLRAGEIPLWNPFQLCGVPFVGVPHSGLFYPGNLAYLFFDAAIAVEITHVAHLFFAALCFVLLARRFELSELGAIAGALCFTWSGWMTTSSQWPSLISGMCWLPATLLAVEGSIAGRRTGLYGLALAVTFQILNGATEFLLYNAYVSSAFAVMLLFQRARTHGSAALVRPVLSSAVAVAAGIALASFQLLPTLEMVIASERSAGALELETIRTRGIIPPRQFLREALTNTGFTTAGVLPVLALGLALAASRWRSLVTVALVLGTGAALLIFGGPVFELYFETPVGGMFRRPHKFLHIYSFALGIVVAIGVTALQGWRSDDRGVVNRRPGWILSVVIGACALWWLAIDGSRNVYLAAAYALVLVFGLSNAGGRRTFIVTALCAVHIASLFFNVESVGTRPFERLEVFDKRAAMFERLRERAPYQRIYISPTFLFAPELAFKQGMLRGNYVVEDYEPLAPKRYGRYFNAAVTEGNETDLFAGGYQLGGTPQWRLMDLAGTRFYVVRRGEPLEKTLRAAASAPARAAFAKIEDDGKVRVYERRFPLPRAYFVPTSKVAATEAEALSMLSDEGFDAVREVVLEQRPEGAELVSPPPQRVEARVSIIAYERERIAIEVDSPLPGYLVLTDLHYPGWSATADGGEVEIYRANYLFRAVHVDPGRTSIVFEYWPRSLSIGLLVSAVTALLMVLMAAGRVWRR